jgi:hypothetical protein
MALRKGLKSTFIFYFKEDTKGLLKRHFNLVVEKPLRGEVEFLQIWQR